MTVDELFDRYKAAFRAGEDPDPAPYLRQSDGSHRRELEALIDGFLATMPARSYDPARLAGTPAGALTRRVVGTLVGEPAGEETWVTLLPQARRDAELLRSEVVHRLAEELGVADRQDKVATYYHRMEHGQLPSAGVSERVLAALSRIVSVPVERLRAAGVRLAPPAGGASGVFARTASPEGPAPPRAEDAPVDDADGRDDVDELFTGG